VGYAGHVLKSLVTALLVLSLPLAQARAFVVCPTEETPPPASDCPCPHAHKAQATAPTGADAGHGDCCDIEFAPADTSNASASAAQDPLVRLDSRVGGLIELAAPPPTFPPIVSASHAVSPPTIVEPFAADGTRVFLATGRLRL